MVPDAIFPDLFRDDVFRIETRRLWLRWPVAADAGAITRLAGDRAVAEMTARIPHPLERGVADAFVARARAGNATGTALTLALCERARPGSLIGLAGVQPRPDGQAPYVGYWLGRPHWGAGLMSEAAGALVHAWFAWAGGTRLESSVRVVNPASRRVLEKAGFVWTGRGLQDFPARGGPVEVDRFRLERGRWAARAKAGAGEPAAAH
jgi:RimJ/RimL family protein N-acetyltransferase